MDHRKKILVVDDDDRVRFVLSGALESLGDDYHIVAASNSKEALDKAEETRFDLLITDLRLPRTDGLALTSAFAKISPDTKIIWITAYGCHRFSENAKRMAICQCLDKPLEIHELREAALDALHDTPSTNGDGTTSPQP